MSGETVDAIGIREILAALPHRYPFLLVDKIIDIRGNEHGIGIKNVTANEPQFAGHFPDNPVMPGVLVLEGIAVEDALANPVLRTSVPFAQPTIAVPNSPGDTYSYQLQFVGQTELGTGMTGFSIGTAFQSYHFQVDATGNGPDNALSQHTQSFYVVGPGT